MSDWPSAALVVSSLTLAIQHGAPDDVGIRPPERCAAYAATCALAIEQGVYDHCRQHPCAGQWLADLAPVLRAAKRLRIRLNIPAPGKAP